MFKLIIGTCTSLEGICAILQSSIISRLLNDDGPRYLLDKCRIFRIDDNVFCHICLKHIIIVETLKNKSNKAPSK